MSIDWFTFIAQIVNFLILVALLRKFLYGPIVRAMSKREEEIGASLREAEDLQREGAERARRYERKMEEIEQQREAMLIDTRRDADAQHKRLTLETRDAIQHKRGEWLQALERERAELLSELQRGAGQLAAEAARRALAELADESLEQRIIAAFATRLCELDEQPRDEIRGVLRDGDAGVFIRSAFEVSASCRTRLRAAVLEEFGYEGPIEFETSSDLICGIELEAGGYDIGWNVNEFLRDLESEFDERLKEISGSARQ